MSPEEVPQNTPTLGLERLVFFSDAVFAIVITLLVLPLTVESRLPTHGSQFAGQLSAFGPKVFTFVISFLVIGRFWMVHHRMFGLFRRHDDVLLMLNLLILLSISFMLFPTAILGAQGEATSREPGMFYAASMTLTSVMFTLTWLYASRAGLVAEDVTREQVSALTIRSCLTTTVFALSIAAAMVSLWAAMFCWLLLMPLVRSLQARYSARRGSNPRPAAGASPH